VAGDACLQKYKRVTSVTPVLRRQYSYMVAICMLLTMLALIPLMFTQDRMLSILSL
jgi:hypothetical protein